MKPIVGHVGVKDSPYYSNCEMVTTITGEFAATPCNGCPCLGFSHDDAFCGIDGHDINEFAIELTEDGCEVLEYALASVECKLKFVVSEDGKFDKPEPITVFNHTYKSRFK